MDKGDRGSIGVLDLLCVVHQVTQNFSKQAQ